MIFSVGVSDFFKLTTAGENEFSKTNQRFFVVEKDYQKPVTAKMPIDPVLAMIFL